MTFRLQDRAASSDFNRHFAEIQRILGRVIDTSGGPYVLIVWTDKPERVGELERYLEDNFFPRNLHAKPIAIVPLSKSNYIDIDTGAPNRGNLVEDIREHLTRQPAMSALVQWEAEVLGAATGVLTDVGWSRSRSRWGRASPNAVEAARGRSRRARKRGR
ncbi:hypothetical protein GCM10025876_37630 [Demequina litorisediminis]|uniref:Uncharacterized protein n=1 Tax=Demequina litorisediminis TaxID=1849022 RepID=A0ABQ6ILJ8_9MICO|nr:hypothetical protein GCM10025876_37630 [Demequina litorisediminis]